MNLKLAWIPSVLIGLVCSCADTHPRAPVIDLVSSTLGGPTPLKATFDAQPSETYAPETAYTWTINGVAVEGEQATLSHTFDAPGRYDVAVHAGNPLGHVSDQTTILVTDNTPTGACNVSQTRCTQALEVVPFETNRPLEEPGAARALSSLQVSAATQWLTFSDAVGTSALRVVVTLRNPTDRAVTLDTTTCRLAVHVFAQPERLGKPLEDSEAACDLGRELTVAPQGERTIDQLFGPGELPDERYYLGVRLTLNPETLELPAGSADFDYTLPFSYEAVTQVASQRGQPSLQSAVTLTNRSDEAVTLTFGACILNVQLYLTAARVGEPVFDFLDRPNFGCPGYLASATVAPGASLLADEFKNFTPIAEMTEALGVAGTYHVRLRFRLNARELIFDPGVLVLGDR